MFYYRTKKGLNLRGGRGNVYSWVCRRLSTVKIVKPQAKCNNVDVSR